ncbi:hypothetical protein CMUS01_08616 [Colletotrichum musicola]|uniref:Uncharacterized protein n=1 Tax=Colletotrichum musicola TaxID=2175873 RepID=A0A8H6KCS7_9PEZI|nr:hypothetical protein CMUS01_08616 [Colletotrichum musicola]
MREYAYLRVWQSQLQSQFQFQSKFQIQRSSVNPPGRHAQAGFRRPEEKQARTRRLPALNSSSGLYQTCTSSKYWVLRDLGRSHRKYPSPEPVVVPLAAAVPSIASLVVVDDMASLPPPHAPRRTGRNMGAAHRPTAIALVLVQHQHGLCRLCARVEPLHRPQFRAVNTDWDRTPKDPPCRLLGSPLHLSLVVFRIDNRDPDPEPMSGEEETEELTGQHDGERNEARRPC